MRYDLPYHPFGTLIVDSRVKPKLELDVSDLPPYLELSLLPASLSIYKKLMAWVVITDMTANGYLKGLRIVRAESKLAIEANGCERISQRDGDSFVLWQGSNGQLPKVCFLPCL